MHALMPGLCLAAPGKPRSNTKRGGRSGGLSVTIVLAAAAALMLLTRSGSRLASRSTRAAELDMPVRPAQDRRLQQRGVAAAAQPQKGLPTSSGTSKCDSSVLEGTELGGDVVR